MTPSPAPSVLVAMPAPNNLEVPPHRYRADSTLLIGLGPGD